ncbi:MAG: bifunctional diaminohydroxyphosphoribosylaminopyrimidine deaminase/5-amino-6-(5-phosphoribosylamino)uracil reductase RibD [Dehalococcoidia bacterium]|jgi:diaminohydroxyphosphoribosylaminopyrimidine deaminase/5-amino-6-(5-phosphoribosylamino)uracil reductase|nr:bifunctional diaminohydroxyphosphoribosylaminopyrimidine deaminase/5-amino-6-(5-phosphoribosylamino)uracil reductase RibD [Dehalococcoidia bacterium]
MSHESISHFMSEAMKLAEQSIPFSSPNPAVGAVIVKNGKIIGKGKTSPFGGRHAEANAIRSVHDKNYLKGATLYCTLEPCSHSGKTPPCTTAIIESKFKNVIIALKDPDSQVNGKGIKQLRKANIQVIIGDGSNEVNNQLMSYIYHRKTGLPFFSAKLASTLDGKIATMKNDSKWISNNASRNRVHKFRSKVDAILVGSKTVIIDNPFLTARRNGKLLKNQPLRIVIDSKGQLSTNYNIFNNDAETLVVTTDASSKKWRKQIEKAGHSFIIIDDKLKQVDLLKFAQSMSELGIMHIHVEGGGQLIGALMHHQLIIKLYLFIAPKIIGNQKAINMIDGLNIEKVSEALKLINTSYEFIKQDILIAGEVDYK